MSDSSTEAQIERWLASLDLRRALAFTAFILFLIAWNRGIALLYGLLALVIGALVVGYVAPRLNLRGISVRRTLPAEAVEGGLVDIEVVVEGPSARAIYMLEVADAFPFAIESEQAPTGFVPRLRGATRLRYNIHCDLRGVHTVGPLRVTSSYPLGLFTITREIPQSTARVLIYPRPFPIERLSLLGGSHRPILGARAASRAGGSDQFFAVREYRHGDSPRHVHWSASARRGELVVKEFEYIHTTEVMIVLDLNERAQRGAGKHSTLEYQVKIALSIAQFALSEGHAVGLYGLSEVPFDIPVRNGPTHYQAILETLARIDARGTAPYTRALREGLAKVSTGGVAVMFHLPRTKGESPPSQTGLFRRHIKPFWIEFDMESFTTGTSARTRSSPGTYYVRRGDDLARKFNA